MTFVLAMLVSSLVPTGHPQWLWGSYAHPSEGMTLPALCFFDYNFPQESGPYAARMTAFGGIWLSWSIGLATITFLKRLLELVTRPMRKRALAHQSTSRDEFRKWNHSMDKNMRKYPIIDFFWYSTHATLRTVWRLLESFGGHIFWLFIMLSWNIYLVVYNKWFFRDLIEAGDNKWGFGQTTPLVLLILPAITIVEQYFAKRNGSKTKWPTNKFQLPQPLIGKTYDESTRITVFLIFEFLVIFSLLAWLNFVSVVTYAVSDSGVTFMIPFLVCLLAAPLVFTHVIHLADNIFKGMKLRKNTWRNAIVAALVALGIGASICVFFLHEYKEFW
ncbi:hypothetical protein KVR01_009399 [Diaporthe batatas]|uniref:uncharacterized protein n=1 Tax=Diaporthe batatas TaxID=748121 RepID=UPI001D040A2F|nr:uncharacterized protein KVR01_009399 [Diaporthe batatas]KAG8161135.1 hypothetical protein KVR01_009399 [Diaporthe batatas]